MFTRKLLILLSAILPVTAFAQGGAAGIQLLERIGDEGVIPVDGAGFGAFGYYFNLIYPWLLGMGAATAVLMATWGGLEIIQAGGDNSKRDEGKNRLLKSLGGLLLLLLSSTILNMINPTFFR